MKKNSMNLFTHLKKIDWIIIFSILGLTAFGLVSIYSSSLASQDFNDFYKQIGFLGVSFLVMLFVSYIDYRKIRENTVLIVLLYLVSVILLVGVLSMPAIRETATWYKIGPFNLSSLSS